MSGLVLEAKRRSLLGKKVKSLRREGVLPGVVYGADLSPIPIELEAHSAGKVLLGVSGSTLIDLNLEGETHSVLLRDVQMDVIRREMLHIDLLKVAMNVAIRAVVPIELIGEAPAVEQQGGVLVTGLSEIEVEALPQDLPERFPVDLQGLKAIDDRITVEELSLTDGVTVLTDSEELIARVIYQEEEMVEEEEVEAFVPVEAEPERVGREELEEEAEEPGEEED